MPEKTKRQPARLRPLVPTNGIAHVDTSLHSMHTDLPDAHSAPCLLHSFELLSCGCLETCLLEISNVVCPAIFVCLNIGTRQPGP